MREKSLILDTCALIWLAAGDKELSMVARNTIERASVVYVSAISAWEISLKAVQGGLILPLEPYEWFKRAIDHHNLVVVPLDIDILIDATKLPWHHRDPADRFIVATALREQMAVVTADGRFAQYGVRVIG